MRFFCYCCVALFGLALAAGVQAQPLRLTPAPLGQALRELSRQADVDLVYARRLVEGQQSNCAYRGDNVEAGLACVLVGTGLEAQRVRQGQYVLRLQVQRIVDEVRSVPARETLSGFVADARTGEVLPGAHIYLPDLRRGATTNDAGFFAIPDLAAGPHRARLSYVGYSSVDTLLLTQSLRSTVRLSPARMQGAALVVETTREGETRLPGLATVPIARLEALPSAVGEEDVLQKLTWLPGVTRSGEVTGGLVVRGGQPDENLYLLDGAPVYHPWHAFTLVSTFQTETFNRVRLHRGLFPAEYGGRLSSVLDAEMKDGNRETPRVTAGVGLLSARYVVESPITKGSSFMVSGRRSYVDQLIGTRHAVEEDGRRDTLRTGYYFYDLSFKVTYRPGYRHRVSLSHYSGGDALDLRLPFDFSLDLSSWLRPADLFFEIDHEWGNQLQSLRYQYLPSPQLFSTLTLYRTAYGAREKSRLRPTDQSSLAVDYRVRVEDFGGRADVDVFPSGRFHTQMGAQVAVRRFQSLLYAQVEQPGETDTARLERTEQRAFEMAVYAQADYRLGTTARVQGGVRASTFAPGAFVHLAPNAGVQLELVPRRLTARLGAAAQVQYLHRLRDRYSVLYDLLSTRWIPAGSDVAPATGTHVALGLTATPRPEVQVEVEAYARQARNILVPEDAFREKDGLEGPGIELGVLLGQYAPTRGRAYGTEVSFLLERPAWLVWTALTVERALRLDSAPGATAYYPSDYDVPFSFKGVLKRRMPRWSLALSGEVRAGYPVATPTARYELGDPLQEIPTRYLYRPGVNEGRLPFYARLDASAGYSFRWLDASWQARLDLYNLFNRRNVIGRLYDPAGETVRVTDRRGLPILPLFEIEVTI